MFRIPPMSEQSVLKPLENVLRAISFLVRRGNRKHVSTCSRWSEAVPRPDDVQIKHDWTLQRYRGDNALRTVPGLWCVDGFESVTTSTGARRSANKEPYARRESSNHPLNTPSLQTAVNHRIFRLKIVSHFYRVTVLVIVVGILKSVHFFYPVKFTILKYCSLMNAS